MQLDEQETPPIWAAFGDLMACLFGLFVLFFVWMVMTQIVLDRELERERASLQEAQARLATLENALAGPLASGLITLVEGRIGIRGAVLFDSNEAELRPEGLRLLDALAAPLDAFVSQHDVALMVSGFTDDRPLRGHGAFRDNWELSAQRALTVTRALVEAGVSPDGLIAAGFGDQHPVVPNDSAAHRAQNRRVEIAPVPAPRSFQARAQGSGTTPRAQGSGTTRAQGDR